MVGVKNIYLQWNCGTPSLVSHEIATIHTVVSKKEKIKNK